MPRQPEDQAAKLAAEIEDLSQQLAALPLTKSNRDERLKLNDLKRAKESALAEVRRSDAVARLKTRLIGVAAELHGLEVGPATRDRRQQLLQERDALKVELELAERGEA